MQYHPRPAGAPAIAPAPAVLLGVVAVIESIIRSALDGQSAQQALALCVVALATTSLAAVLVAPQAAAIAVVAASVVSLLLFHTLTAAAVITTLIVLYRLARQGEPRPRAQLVAVSLPICFVVLALTHPFPTAPSTPAPPTPSSPLSAPAPPPPIPVGPGSGWPEAEVLTVLLASLAPATAFAGIAARARSEAEIHDAARRAAAGEEIEHAARGERARIARELHDVVAHHISMIAVQAETARVTIPELPPAGAKRLSAIGDTARAALTEMRRLLGVLREDAGADEPELRPQPGLEQLNELLDEAREASGSGARLILTGAPTALDPGVELAVYRIVQEALTNARRHAPGAGVDVELRYGARALRLRIRDNGPGPPAEAATAGHGLSGMRERAAAVGGDLRTGPAPGGGFLVQATLPTGTSEAVT